MKVLNVVYKGIVPDELVVTLVTVFVLSIMVFFPSFSVLEKVACISALISGITFIALIGVEVANCKIKSDKVDYYEVTLDDTVKMTEFYDKYKIISKRGKIYRIREK